MSCSRRQLFRILLVPAAILAAGWLLQTSVNCALIIANGNAPPGLYLWAGGKAMAPSEDFVPGQAPPNLVVCTHGWIEKSRWPADLARAIGAGLDRRQWLCGWYDWRRQAQRVNPADVARYGRNTAGELLGEKIVALNPNWKHVHLIGHSAGAWVISEAAKVVAEETGAEIHLTFLDAYVPPFWDEQKLGDLAHNRNVRFWADHYFTRDMTLGATQIRLSNAHNVDLTKIDPGVNDHKFPWHWYHATVAGEYVTAARYAGKAFFNQADGIEYGFARSLEAGADNWSTSRTLSHGNEPVTLEPAESSLVNWNYNR